MNELRNVVTRKEIAKNKNLDKIIDTVEKMLNFNEQYNLIPNLPVFYTPKPIRVLNRYLKNKYLHLN